MPKRSKWGAPCIQPEIAPPGRGDQIPAPEVRHLMRNRVSHQKQPACSSRLSHGATQLYEAQKALSSAQLRMLAAAAADLAKSLAAGQIWRRATLASGAQNVESYAAAHKPSA